MSPEILDKAYDGATWGSHLPALLGAIAATDGPVLELGVGHFSTPVLHAVCQDRLLISVERDNEWQAKFGRLGRPNHWFACSLETALELAGDTHFSVALIDDSPGGAHRAESFKMLIGRSDFVIVHDYHLENREAIEPLLDRMYRYHVTRQYMPPTLIASQFREIPQPILDL